MRESNDFRPLLDRTCELGERIQRRGEDLAEAGATDAGFAVSLTLREVELAAHYLRSMEEEIRWVENGTSFGTVAAIFPYDAPAVMMARLGGAAILTGNRLRFSFSSWTPRSARILADISKSFPMFEPTLGVDNREFGHQCVKDHRVRVLFMSGASAVGAAYRDRKESFDKVFFAGPGGMPAAVVFEDADVEAAIRFIGRRAFVNGGQYCTTLKKALIHRKHYDRVRQGLLQWAGSLRVGDPLDLETDIGPIRVERTINLLELALKRCKGASVLTGGIDRPWVYPMIVEMEDIPDLELFGPFLALKPFDDPECVVREVTDTRYGFLLVYFGTPPEHLDARFSEHFGMVYADPDFEFIPLRKPFGGKKESGWILERSERGWIERDGGFLYSRELVRQGAP